MEVCVVLKGNSELFSDSQLQTCFICGLKCILAKCYLYTYIKFLVSWILNPKGLSRAKYQAEYGGGQMPNVGAPNALGSGVVDLDCLMTSIPEYIIYFEIGSH